MSTADSARFRIKVYPLSRYRVTCPGCGGASLKDAYSCGMGEECPAWRCMECNIRFILTNPSYLKLK